MSRQIDTDGLASLNCWSRDKKAEISKPQMLSLDPDPNPMSQLIGATITRRRWWWWRFNVWPMESLRETNALLESSSSSGGADPLHPWACYLPPPISRSKPSMHRVIISPSTTPAPSDTMSLLQSRASPSRPSLIRKSLHLCKRTNTALLCYLPMYSARSYLCPSFIGMSMFQTKS